MPRPGQLPLSCDPVRRWVSLSVGPFCWSSGAMFIPLLFIALLLALPIPSNIAFLGLCIFAYRLVQHMLDSFLLLLFLRLFVLILLADVAYIVLNVLLPLPLNGFVAIEHHSGTFLVAFACLMVWCIILLCLLTFGTKRSRQLERSGHLNQSLRMWEILVGFVGENSLINCDALVEMAGIHAKLGNLSEAMAFYNRVFTLFEKRILYRDNCFDSYQEFIVILIQQGQFSEALSFHEKTIAQMKRYCGPKDHLLGPILVRAADIYVKQGLYSEALIYCERALSIEFRTGNTRHDARYCRWWRRT